MLWGARKARGKEGEAISEKDDVVKLFFDSFSKRTARVEEGFKTLFSEVEKLKLARDRSQISDIVLLERLQRLERMTEESLTWIKRVAESAGKKQETRLESVGVSPENSMRPIISDVMVPVQSIVAPSGATGSLRSITTPTELQVLSLLADRGAMSAPEIGRVVGRSREHSARLMRRLFENGYVRRDQARIPFRYSLVERVKQTFKKSDSKPEGQETVAVPQT